MDNFKVIYRILRFLEGAMDFAEPDYAPIKHDELEISEERWKAIVMMLVDNGYIEGIVIRKYMHSNTPSLVQFKPFITLKGIEYLTENSTMRKLMELAKGIKEAVPFI